MSVSPDLLLQAYAQGIFPMAEGREATEMHWVDPRRRGIIPLDGFHIARSLRGPILRAKVTLDHDFAGVVQGCADRPETWINSEIFALYAALHAMGHAHSLEVWQDGRLVGGVYGVVLGAAFFGESMFSRVTDASKVALAYLVHLLRAGGFTLFDTQFLTPHLASLGAVEISRAEYHRRLAAALKTKAQFLSDYPFDPSAVAGTSQRSTQTS